MQPNLQYRRQFLLAKAALPLPSDWQQLPIGPYVVYAHPDLELNTASDSGRSLVLLGYLFDAETPEKTNRDILKDILERGESMEALRMAMKRYAGRYVIIYQNAHEFVAWNDALALREVYYCTQPNRVVCGSQPNLIAQYAEPGIGLTSDAAIQDFYRNELVNAKWIGDDTCFEGVKHLLPNHYLDIESRSAGRYWPKERLASLALPEAVRRGCDFLRGMLQAASQRHSLMMAVTAGTDSRTLLAASRDLSDKIHYFINQERDLTERSPDIWVPKALFAKLGLPFHVHQVPKEVNKRFEEVFLSNTFFASRRILPTIYNVYFQQHSTKLNLLGIGEIGRTRYGRQPRRLSAYRLAYAVGYKNSAYVRKVCEGLLPELAEVGRQCGVNVLTLLYWEQMLGNWGAVGNSESDIAIEEFNPCASHLFYEILLGVDPRFSKYGNNLLFREMIRNMWPEVLALPINPPSPRWQDQARHWLKQAGCFGVLKRLKYHAYHTRYLLGQSPKAKGCGLKSK